MGSDEVFLQIIAAYVSTVIGKVVLLLANRWIALMAVESCNVSIVW